MTDLLAILRETAEIHRKADVIVRADSFSIVRNLGRVEAWLSF